MMKLWRRPVGLWLCGGVWQAPLHVLVLVRASVRLARVAPAALVLTNKAANDTANPHHPQPWHARDTVSRPRGPRRRVPSASLDIVLRSCILM